MVENSLNETINNAIVMVVVREIVKLKKLNNGRVSQRGYDFVIKTLTCKDVSFSTNQCINSYSMNTIIKLRDLQNQKYKLQLKVCLTLLVLALMTHKQHRRGSAG